MGNALGAHGTEHWNGNENVLGTHGTEHWNGNGKCVRYT